MSETNEEARNSSPLEAPQDIEAVLMAVWRRVMEEGCGPELSITEAAAVLGASVQSVRKRIAAGLIPAYRDAHGRVRIVPRVGLPGEASFDSETSSMVGRLLQDLKSTRQQLSQAVHERAGLIKDKAAAEQALEHTKEELSAMWRLLSARTSSETQAPTATKPAAEIQPAEVPTRVINISPARLNVSKIQLQVTAVRKLAKRRRWPWALVS